GRRYWSGSQQDCRCRRLGPQARIRQDLDRSAGSTSCRQPGQGEPKDVYTIQTGSCWRHFGFSGAVNQPESYVNSSLCEPRRSLLYLSTEQQRRTQNGIETVDRQCTELRWNAEFYRVQLH